MDMEIAWNGNYTTQWGEAPQQPPISLPSPPQTGLVEDGYGWDRASVLLYIDNSNIFETAKKHSGHKKGYINEIPDVACRIDVGKLISKAIGARGLLRGKLYGSEPPNLHEVWEAIRKKHVLVEIFQRSKWTLKEKETDSSLAADAVEDIITEKENAGPNRTLILFSGDRDLLRVVEKAIKFGYKVEIWSFKSSINNTVKRRAHQDPLNLKVFYIDDIFEEITFTKVVWSTKKIPPERSLVTRIALSPESDKKKFLRTFVAKSGDIFKLPMMGKYLDNYEYVVLVPCIKEHYTPQQCQGRFRSEQATTRTYDYYKHIQPFTHILDEHYEKLGISIKIETWINFLSSRHPINGNSIFSAHRFQQLALEDDEEEEEDVENAALSEDESEDFECTEFFDVQHEDLSHAGGDFKPVLRKVVKRRRAYSDHCDHKFWCPRGLHCIYHHTAAERDFFRLQKDVKLRHLYKIKPCSRDVCPYNDKPYLCGYAHSLEESRCLVCKQAGQHWMEQCPFNTRLG